MLKVRFPSGFYHFAIQSGWWRSAKLKITLEEIDSVYPVNFRTLVHEEATQEYDTLLNRKLKKGSYTWIIAEKNDILYNLFYRFRETGIGVRLKNGRRIAIEMNDVNQFLKVISTLLDKSGVKTKNVVQREKIFSHDWDNVYDKRWIFLFSWASEMTLTVNSLMIIGACGIPLLILTPFETSYLKIGKPGIFFWGVCFCLGFWALMFPVKYIMRRLHLYLGEQYVELSERLVINGFNVEPEDIQSIESVTVNPLPWPPVFWQYRKYDLIALESAGPGIVLQIKYGKPVLICISGVEKLKNLLLHRLNTPSSDYLHSEQDHRPVAGKVIF
jgi:hypothetical protein